LQTPSGIQNIADGVANPSGIRDIADGVANPVRHPIVCVFKPRSRGLTNPPGMPGICQSQAGIQTALYTRP